MLHGILWHAKAHMLYSRFNTQYSYIMAGLFVGLVIIGGILLLMLIAWAAMNPMVELVLFELVIILVAFSFDPVAGLVVLAFWVILDGIMCTQNNGANQQYVKKKNNATSAGHAKSPSQRNKESGSNNNQGEIDILKNWVRLINYNKSYTLDKIEDGFYIIEVKNDTNYTLLVSHIYIKIHREGILVDYFVAINNSSSVPCEPGESIRFVTHHAIEIKDSDKLTLDASSIAGRVMGKKHKAKEPEKVDKYSSEIETINELVYTTKDQDLVDKLKIIKSYLIDVNNYCNKNPDLYNKYSVSRLHDIYIPKIIEFVRQYNDMPVDDAAKEASKYSLLETLDNVEYVIKDLSDELYQAEEVSLNAGLQALNNKIALDGYNKDGKKVN